MAAYAWADLHGRIDIFLKGLTYLKPEDKIYFLGDAADRGPEGWEIIKAIIEDPRFVYIKGNHEDLMIKAIGHYLPEHFRDDWFHWNENMNLWFWNGGEVTYDAFMDDTTISPEKKIEILHKIAAFPFCAVYNNNKGQRVLLSHAGCDCFEAAETWDEEKFIWDRNHLMFYDTWNGDPDEVIVHGHTPIELMVKEQHKNIQWLTDKHMQEGVIGDHFIEPQPWPGKGAYWYAKNHKVNIDTGAIWNSTSVLLNLDTWEETIIDCPPLDTED